MALFHLFPYREGEAVVTGDGTERTPRPIVDVRLDCGELDWTMPALVDTGATHCLFPVGAAQALGIDVVRREGRRFNRFRIAGEERPAIAEYVTLTLPPFEDLNWLAEVWFFLEEWDLPFGLLGNDGFLDKWVVSFNRSGNYFVVESVPEFDQRVPRDAFQDFQRFYPDEWAPPA